MHVRASGVYVSAYFSALLIPVHPCCARWEVQVHSGMGVVWSADSQWHVLSGGAILSLHISVGMSLGG